MSNNTIVSKTTVKRLIADIKELSMNPLSKDGIYYKHDESNMLLGYALIIGPQGTPYAAGNFLFKFLFPTDYPFSPPKVTYYTNDGYTRFNPNLYKCGKVCLSILGTWSGPGWTTVMNLITVLMDLQTLMNDNPIQNEPGYESKTGSAAKVYRNLVGYYNLVVAQFQLIEQTLIGFECFKEIMERQANFFFFHLGGTLLPSR